MGSMQDVYAANLLQRCGYPLHSPEPRGELGEPYDKEGFQIGDIGHINDEGEFNPLFNICFPLSGKLRDRGFPEHKPIDFGDPYRKAHALPHDHVFMTAVHREVNVSRPGVAYELTAKSDAGAVLILPSGATLFDLPDDFHLESFRQAATKYARLWCERSKHDSLYLVTGMYKTRDFTLASFSTGHPHGKVLVELDTGTYKWTCAFEAYSRTSPPHNNYENQTILIKGFRMTVRWSWLPVVERVTRSQSRTGRWIASLIAILIALLQTVFEITSTWLSGTTVERISPSTRLFHPADIINRYLLDKNPHASVAITHDNEWVDMLEKKSLHPEDLMQEDRLRAFLEREYTWDSDSDVVYLRSKIGNTKDTDQSPESLQPISTKEHMQVVITHMRAENAIVGLERVPIGFYVQVDIADRPSKRTKNKSTLVYDLAIQWDDVIDLPSDPSIVVKLTVCASYEFSPMLGRGEPIHVLEKTVGELLHQTRPFTFSHWDGKDLSLCASLLVAVQVWHYSYLTPGLNEADVALDLDGYLWPTQVTEATNKGHDALLRYSTNHNDEDLEHCITLFRDAVISCSDEHSCRAATLCNLARAEFITYRSLGTLCHLEEAIAHYRKALELRQDGHQDRPMTLLYLAETLLYRYGTMGLDADGELYKLLHELKNICSEGTHGRRAADVVFQTHELFKLRDSSDSERLNELISTLDAAAHEPPDMYFDKPARFNNLGLALQKRFQLSGNTVDLDRAIEWFQKAMEFTPTKHLDRSKYLNNLSNALLTRSQREGVVALTGK